MVTFYSDEQSNPEIEIKVDTDTGYSLRRTSARIKTLEANRKDKRASPEPESSSPDRKVKKRKLKKKPSPQLGEDASNDDVSDAVAAAHDDVSEAEASGSIVPAAGKKGAEATVTETLRAFNKHYLHFIQEEEKRVARLAADKKKNKKNDPKSKKAGKAKEPAKNPARRPDLKAITEMMKTGAIINHDKRFGPVPGVDVGHQFFSRAEMVVVGFHQHWLNGIDYIGKSAGSSRKAQQALDMSRYTLPLTVSIVLSGQYEDDLDNCEDIVYTGQGGHNLLGDKRQVSDQKLLRGNLGLKNCFEQSLPVRVVRGHKCQNSYVGKVYTYDGLYKVVNYWAEKGHAGFTVYKFRLKRLEGQPPLTTSEVHFTRGRTPQSFSEIRGLVCEDISDGLEDIPIPVTNLVDDPPISPLGSGFVYIKDMKYSKDVSIPKIAPTGCNCKGSCVDSRLCACAKLNGGDFPYVQRDGGRLVEPKSVVFECGPSCKCGPACVNRTGQKGCRFRLEIFRTPKKGWGVRSWDYIPSGAPICEYIGLMRRTAELNHAADNSYVFDIDCLQTMKGMDGRESRLRDVSLPSHLQEIGEEASESVPFCIDAAQTGNVARFINHSCQPNLFVQCMLSCHHDIKQAKVMFVAADNIPPLKELTYDYGYALDSVIGPDGETQQMACYCGANECRKRLF